jgi:ribosomal protein S18 acetylase RimI-like enzyme
MNGTDLSLCRKADTLALIRDWLPSDRESIVRRIRESVGLFHVPDAGDYYLSKIGLLPQARRKGFGRMLLEGFLERGAAAGFTRFMLDVSADNALALRLYMSAGFRVVSESQHPSGTMTYLSMILNRKKPSAIRLEEN